MDLEKNIEHFYTLVAPSHPNEWEIEDILEELAPLSPDYRKLLFDKVPAVWPVSNSLCFSFLSEGRKVIHLFSEEILGEWVRQILFHYEKGGLREARIFMANVEGNFLQQCRGHSEVKLEDHRGRLVAFIRGVSGRPIDIVAGAESYTDTRTIYLPSIINHFTKIEDNILLYKLIVAIQWSLVAVGTFHRDLRNKQQRFKTGEGGNGSPPMSYDATFAYFQDELLAHDLYLLLEFHRALRFLETELPGLWRMTSSLRKHFGKMVGESCEREKSKHLYSLFSLIFNWERESPVAEEYRAIFAEESVISDDIFTPLSLLYEKVEHFPGEYEPCDFSPILGALHLKEGHGAIEEVRKQEKDAFIALLADLLENESNSGEVEKALNSSSENNDSISFVIGSNNENDSVRPFMIIDNEEVKLPDDLRELTTHIADDFGNIPDAYVAAAAGIAGKGRPHKDNFRAADIDSIEKNESGVHFDEWDYRRDGYRQDWCSVHLKEITLSQSTFVSATLEKYLGQLAQLRRQFEMMRTHERFVRRRRHGDDIDLDAVIDTLGDIRAGLPPSERLFVRLLRDERDIATQFLVDMSNSTEGWVGKRIKEALVLLCEAMEVIGDRYGIYGFSGMRRSRCELFHIKHIEEVFSSEVQQRIGSISPREYTRMGPPIRYMTKMLSKIDAKVRLLLILSDGKPEDYNDYKGEYAIEDTKKALSEARGIGLHPFCITIDQQPHDYLEHMSGRNSYCFVKKLDVLPAKLADIYRTLTR